MKLSKHIPNWLHNKYLLTGMGFVVWLTFFDDRDLITNLKRSRELHKLEQSRAYFQQQIQATRKELDQLKNDPAILEKYARERYRMKKDDEDLFITPE